MEYRGRASVVDVESKGYGLFTSADIVYIRDDRNRSHIKIEFIKDGKPYSIKLKYCDIKRVVKEANRKWREEESEP